MVDIARLGLAVDSSQVDRGILALNQLTGAAGQASRAVVASAVAQERANYGAASAALAAARASGTATKEEIASAVAKLRTARAAVEQAKAEQASTAASISAANAAQKIAMAAGQATAASQRLAAASHDEAAGQRVATAATQVHTAALHANNAAMRMGNQVRTNMIYQLNDVGVSLASGMSPIMVAVQQLPQMLQFGLKPAIESILGLAKGLLTTFWPIGAAIGAVSLAVAGLTHEINRTAEVQVGFFDVALAGWQLFAESVASLVAPVFGAIGGWLQQGWDAAVPVLKGAVNMLIGGFVGGFNAISLVWSNLPQVMGDVTITAVNVVLAGVTRLLNDSRTQVGQFLSWVSTLPLPGINALAGAAVGGMGTEFTAPQYSNPYAGTAGAVAGGASSALGGALSTDYAGNMFGAISGRAQEIAAARQEMEALGGATTAANDNARTLANDGLKAAADRAKEFAGAIGDALKGLVKDALQGKFSLASLGDALSSIGDKLFDIGWNLLSGGFGGAQGGGGGGIFGFLGSLFGFATGGVFNAGHQVQAFANGGIVSKPTLFPMANGAGLMGEAGPEAIMPLRRGPDGRLGVSAANQNQPQGVHVTFGVAADGNGNIMPFVKSVSQETVASAAPAIVGTAVSQSNKSAPSAMARHQQQRAGGDYRLG